jgi:hypothetical protein
MGDCRSSGNATHFAVEFFPPITSGCPALAIAAATLEGIEDGYARLRARFAGAGIELGS